MASVTILYGSQTGNAENLAFELHDKVSETDHDVQTLCMEEFNVDDLTSLDVVLIVTSTHGDGEAPDNASELLSFLKFEDELELPNIRFSVFGLGDSYYPHFCQCGKDFDAHLEQRGASRLAARRDCDVYFDEQFQEWANDVLGEL